MTSPRFRRNESGVVLPTRVLAIAVSAVALGALIFVADDPNSSEADRAATVRAEQREAPAQPTVAPAPTLAPKPKPAVDRGETMVVVFNNSRVRGLASRTATRVQAAGWDVVGADNWYGTFDGSTVYYPPKFKPAAEALAGDLGIKRVLPAIEPMQFDRLTVILTDDFG